MLFNKTLSAPDNQDIARHLIDGTAIARFAAVLLAEIADNASQEQLRGFFTATGRRLAATQPVDTVRRLDQLAEIVNLFWAELGWGRVDFEVDDEGIDIFHSGMPQSLEGDREGLWAKIAPALLEGAYDGWFRQMGSSGALKTVLRREVEGRIELRHGL